MPEQRYTDEQAKEILRRAMNAEGNPLVAGDGAIAHDDLLAAAEEVGISRKAVEEAIAEVQIKGEVEQMVQRRQGRRRRNYLRSLGFFAVVNVFLFVLDEMTPGGPWFQWPLIGWGLMMTLGALKVFLPDHERDTREAARALGRRKQEEERERRRRERKKGARDLEDVIEDGVGLLLGALASGVKAAIDTGTAKADSEFQRYVNERRSGTHRDGRRGDATGRTSSAREDSRGDAPGPRVRAQEVREAEEEIEEFLDPGRVKGKKPRS